MFRSFEVTLINGIHWNQIEESVCISLFGLEYLDFLKLEIQAITMMT